MPKVPNLLRTAQVEANKTELKRLEETVRQPHVQDPGLIHRQIRNLRTMLDTLTPRPFQDAEVDKAVARRDDLERQLLVDLPTNMELRRNPPGTRDKLLSWERKNKAAWLEWKYLSMRLDPENPSAPNFERLRPLGSDGSVSNINAQIPGKIVGLPAGEVTPGAVASDTELDVLAEAAPDLREAFATLGGEHRAAILDAVRKHIEAATAPAPKPERTPEQQAAIEARMAKARAARKPKAVAVEAA